MEISVFRNAKTPTDFYNIEADDILDNIENGKYEKQITIIRALTNDVSNNVKNAKTNKQKYKSEKLVSPVFQGVFSKRAKSKLIKSSGIAVIDLDHVNDPTMVRDYYFENYRFIYAGFISPSGDGVKLLCRIPEVINDNEYKKYYINLLNIFDGANRDESTKDISRICFISWDPELRRRELNNTAIFTNNSTDEQPKLDLNSTSNNDILKIGERMVMNSVDGQKHFTLLKAATLMGGYIGGGFISEHEAVDCLVNAISLRSPGNANNDKKTILTGINFGKQTPIKTEPKKRQLHSSNREYTATFSKKDVLISLDNIKPDPIDFPTHIFPAPIYNFIDDINKNAGFSTDFLSVSVISAIATVIGKNALLKVNGTWTTSPIFWFSIVGEPGSKKSHPVKFVLKPLKRIDLASKDIYDEEMERYNIYQEMDDKHKKEYREYNGNIQHPKYKQVVVKDATIEALFHVHENNEKGILIYKDELIGWLNAMGQYKGGKGDEMEKWLSMFDGDDLVINRVSKEPLVMGVTNVNLIGTIQPDVINKISKDNGLLQRFLFTNNDNKIKRFVSNEVNHMLVDDYVNTIVSLNNMYGSMKEPDVYDMSAEARNIFIDIDNFLCKIQEADDTEPILVQYCEKLKTYTPRFALLSYIMNTMYEDTADLTIDSKNMTNAFDMVKYFLNTAKIMFLESREKKEVVDARIKLNGKSLVEKIIVLNSQGISKNKIAKELDISRQYIYKTLKNAEKIKKG